MRMLLSHVAAVVAASLALFPPTAHAYTFQLSCYERDGNLQDRVVLLGPGSKAACYVSLVKLRTKITFPGWDNVNCDENWVSSKKGGIPTLVNGLNSVLPERSRKFYGYGDGGDFGLKDCVASVAQVTADLNAWFNKVPATTPPPAVTPKPTPPPTTTVLATTTDGGTTQVCIKAITGRITYDDGYIDISVDEGKGAGYKRQSNKLFQTLRSTVVNKCYDQIKGVRVRGTDNNAWVGSITFSTDGGSTYTAGACTTCKKNPGGSTG